MSITLNNEHPIYDDVIAEDESGNLISAAEVEAIAARPTWDSERVVAASYASVREAAQ